MVIRCIVPGCTINSKKSKLFGAPYTNKLRWDEWKKTCPWLSLFKPMQLQWVRFCALHFNPLYISDENKLSRDAVPERVLPSIEALYRKFGKELFKLVAELEKTYRPKNDPEASLSNKEETKAALDLKNKNVGRRVAVIHTANKKAPKTCKKKPVFKKPFVPSLNCKKPNTNVASGVTCQKNPTIEISPLTSEITPKLSPHIEDPDPDPDIIASDTIVLDDLPDMFDMVIEDSDPQPKPADYCRCCLNKDHLSELWCDYLSDGERFNYGMMLIEVFDLSIKYNKLDQICWSCADRLKDASLFKKVVVAADEVLQEQELYAEKSNPSQGNNSIFINENNDCQDDGNTSVTTESTVDRYVEELMNESKDDGNTSVATEETVDRDVEDYMNESKDDGNTSVATEETVDREVEDLMNESKDDENTSVATEETVDREVEDYFNESIDQINTPNLRKRPADTETDDEASPKRTFNLSSLIHIEPMETAQTASVAISKKVEKPKIIQNILINPLVTRNPEDIKPKYKVAISKNDPRAKIMYRDSKQMKIPIQRRYPTTILMPKLTVARPKNSPQPMRMPQEPIMTNTIPEHNVAISGNLQQSTVLQASNMSMGSMNSDYSVMIPGENITRPDFQESGMFQVSNMHYSEVMNAGIPLILPELKVIRSVKPRSTNMPLEPKNTVATPERDTRCENPLQTPRTVWQDLNIESPESQNVLDTIISKLPDLTVLPVAKSENVEEMEVLPKNTADTLASELGVTRPVTSRLVLQDLNIQPENKANIAISTDKDTSSKNTFKIPRIVLQDNKVKRKTEETSEPRVAISKNRPIPKIVLKASKFIPLGPRNMKPAVINPENDTSLKNPLQIPRVMLQDLNMKSFHSKAISELKLAISENVKENEVLQASKTQLEVASSKNVEGTEIALQDLLQKSSYPKNPANIILIPEPRVASFKNEETSIVLQAPNMQPLCCVETIVTCSSCRNQFTDIFTLQLHMMKCLKINK